MKHKYEGLFVSLFNKSSEPLVLRRTSIENSTIKRKDTVVIRRYNRSNVPSIVNGNNRQIIPTAITNNRIRGNTDLTQGPNPPIDDSVEYFPWNDRVNYEEICKSLQKKLNSFKGPPIIHKGHGGGLGHMFTSLLNVLTTALVVQRPLSCIIS